MHYRKLGNIGLLVSEIAFGGGNNGGGRADIFTANPGELVRL